MFLVLGTIVLAITYGLVARSATISIAVAFPRSSSGAAGVAVAPAPLPSPKDGKLPPGAIVSKGALIFPDVKSGVSEQHNADVGKLLSVSWVALALTTIGSTLLGWLLAGRVLRPVREITEGARMISAGSLHQRLALDGPNDEFKRLGDTLDDLLGRLEASFLAQRRFVANASHELRTPLTLERTLLQVALADPNASAEKLRATCEELLAAGIEQERLLESLLVLASSERGLEQRQQVDLAALADQELAVGRPDVERLSLRVERSLEPSPTTGDPALIECLIGNLIDNAAQYNSLGGVIDVRTAVEDQRPVVAVANTGPIVAPADVERLLEPFQRAERDRTSTGGGHGLGLSIVRAIAIAHDAELTVEPRAFGGLLVTVRFPPPPEA